MWWLRTSEGLVVIQETMWWLKGCEGSDGYVKIWWLKRGFSGSEAMWWHRRNVVAKKWCNKELRGCGDRKYVMVKKGHSGSEVTLKRMKWARKTHAIPTFYICILPEFDCVFHAQLDHSRCFHNSFCRHLNNSIIQHLHHQWKNQWHVVFKNPDSYVKLERTHKGLRVVCGSFQFHLWETEKQDAVSGVYTWHLFLNVVQ